MANLPTVEEFMDKTFVTLKKDMDVYHAVDILLDRGITSAVVVDDFKPALRRSNPQFVF